MENLKTTGVVSDEAQTSDFAKAAVSISPKFIPILFSTAMVEALLGNNKTQTRRLMKPQPIGEFKSMSTRHRVWDSTIEENPNPISTSAIFVDEGTEQIHQSTWKPGDVLWVRETWFSTRFDFKELLDCGIVNHLRYKADGNYDPNKDCVGRSWKSPLHMPKGACRLFLRVKSIRAERVQYISNEDIRKEGAAWFGCTTHRLNWQLLWEKINGEQSWIDNPWVWVIEFERIEKPTGFC